MTDPFSIWEEKHRVSLHLLRILSEYDYPTIISTKSPIISKSPYLDILRKGNFYVRMSITWCSDGQRGILERGVASREDRMEALSRLSQIGVSTSIRLQPVIFGEEHAFESFLQTIVDSGVRHVSAEYLKLPMDSRGHIRLSLERDLPYIYETYGILGAYRIGRELWLPAHVKERRLKNIKYLCENSGIVFGFADNELLHLNNFISCCNAADMFLRDAHYFNDNIVSRLKGSQGGKVEFGGIDNSDRWNGEFSMMPYLNSKSRMDGTNSWNEFLRKKWHGPRGSGGPRDFFSVTASDQFDAYGDRMFNIALPSAD